MNRQTKLLTYGGLFTAAALVFGYIEMLIPIPFPIPGMKLGLANVAILAVLYYLGEKEALVIDILRVTLSSILFGNPQMFFFSIAGALASIIVMIGLKKTKKFGIIGVSVAGGVAHNAGQILVAIWVMGTSAIIYMLPALALFGIVTGILVGVTGGLVADRLPKTDK
jgi:heptaprenyl diphosphate synthase